VDIDKINELYYRHLELLKENAGEKDGSAHPYPGPLTDLGGGYYWAAERDGDRDDQWYNFFLLKSANAENNLYKTLSSFIKVRDYDRDLVSDESDRIKAWLKKNKGIDLDGEKIEANAKDVKKYNRSSGLPPEDPEDPYYDTWQSIAQDHVEDEEQNKGEDWRDVSFLDSLRDSDSDSSKISYPAFVTAYDETREYGGPEEGGWWYNAYKGLASIKVNSPDHAERLAKNFYNIHKGRTDGKLKIYIEKNQYSQQKLPKPRWE